MHNIKIKLQNSDTFFVLIPLFLLSIISIYLYYHLGINLYYGDAMSRLNIARKIIDNLTPGLAQIGNVWLPLPQLLMLPFIWNNFMWHSGLAGSIVSMSAFILGGFYIYKTGTFITNSKIASILGLSIYALNINMLYLQTTAMSESVFVCSFAATIYYSFVWTHDTKITNLMKLALAINAVTLTRYEGYSILLASVVIVALYSFISTRAWSKTESNLIMFTSLAFFGFTLWTIYLWLIYGDPIYWIHFYVAAPVTTANYIPSYAKEIQHLSLFQSIWKYLTTTIWMSGLIPTAYGIIGIFLALVTFIRTRDYRLLPLLLPFSVFLFMVFAMMRNTPVSQPELTFQSIISPTTNYFSEFNIRYGILMLPFLAIFSMYLFKYKNVFLRAILVLLLGVQLYSYFQPNYSVILQLPVDYSHISKPSYDDVHWLQAHYVGGLIMVSALKHDPEIFHTNFSYKTFIHEGTGKYWKTSIKNPTVYASWIWMDINNPDDQVTMYLKNSHFLKDSYNLVYNNEGTQIYEIKTKPEITISD